MQISALAEEFKQPLAAPHSDRPIRAELFGLDHLENHARAFGPQMKSVRVEAGRPLLGRFLHNARLLRTAHDTISRAYRDRETLGHDAEWLLDNYHIIGDSLAEIRTDLPNGYYRWLPKLIEGPLAGFPRVYALALDLIAHTDSSLDETNISRFVQAFQTITPLSVGEIWAVPIMLRVCLIDNLRRLAEQIVRQRECRQQAQAWIAGNLPPIEERLDAGDFTLEECRPDWRNCYVAHLIEGLHDNASTFPKAVVHLQNALEIRGHLAAETLRREKERQAANQVSIANCVISLRLLSALDWSRFFERTSLLEAALRQDPAGFYAKQDFATRDHYRRTVEELARRSHHSELEVAETVLDLARSRPEGAAAALERHIGYYLADRGRCELETRVGYRASWSAWARRRVLAHPQAWYFGGFTTITLLLITGLACGCANLGAGPGLTALLAMTALLPITELAVGLLNLMVPALISPRVLPRIDYQGGAPEDCPTFVVIPSLLTSPASAAALVERLEIHYLSNPDEQLFFGLLTDFADAATETVPEDAACLRAAEGGIRALNVKYAQPGRSRFFLFHRRRQWNPIQECWMGWERKRGKLAEFNRLLRHDDIGSFASVVGELTGLPRIRFVITLDSDTQLPREAARKLIATLAHPLNQPYYDPAQARVVRGFGILQPRVSLSLRGARKSLFARIFTGSAGLDPYTTAVSDTYQDLFGSGSFTGKGIYDLDAFVAATDDRFPENRILSHDLVEGNYARCGLVSDVELLDDFPAHYQAYSRREHRWVRGDWQIADWLFGVVPGPKGQTRKNTLPLLERWKIFDNLRRSLTPPALVVMLVLGWTILPGAWWWTSLAALVIGWPLFSIVSAWPFRAARLLLSGTSRLPALDGLGATAGQALLSGTFLLDQARSMLDAIGRTLFRLIVSQRRLLDWEAAATTERRVGAGLGHFLRTMWPVSAAALALGGLLLRTSPTSLPAASPFLIGWFVSPLAAYWVSRPRRSGKAKLSAADQALLRRWSRKTWGFFETFVNEADHWLPPDNYQEDPKNEVAHRTSPTNIGLYLLSCVAAHDLGYLTLSALVDRLENSFKTLQRLERAHGHFFNWYDTQSLTPLQPIYLSTVDSGNLAASLVALKQSLLEKVSAPLWGAAVAHGLLDTLQLVEEAAALVHDEAARGERNESVRRQLSSLRHLAGQRPGAMAEWSVWMAKMIGSAEAIRDSIAYRVGPKKPGDEELSLWSDRLASLARDRGEEFKLFVAGDQERTRSGVEQISLDQLADSDPKTSAASQLRERCLRLAQDAAKLAADMDFRLLYNPNRDLFAVGYNLTLGRIDGSHYDLLASEASLTSFLAIARGDVPRKHWFHLGRPLTQAYGSVALLSWGGTMFEYLMPRLFLDPYPETLLEDSQRAAVEVQIHYGRQCRRPWGISESAYNAVDGQWNYQYQTFGVPGLGLKRGLGQDLVVTPYATGLALMVDPRRAVRNYLRLRQEGAEGRYGMFEAIDFTADRLPENKAAVVVKCFMAHHQGMTLLALENWLLDNPLPRRFHAEPMVRATELLLQERVPREPPLAQPAASESTLRPSFQEASPQLSRRLTTPHTAHPRTQLLASEQYSLMITNAGAGQSLARGLAVTRWREDRTCDNWGQFLYVRDLRSGECWSAGYQPICRDADEYEVIFANDRAVFRRVDGKIETRMEITVSPEYHAEVRRLTLTNHDSRSHYLEATSYAEVVLAPQAADVAHPAFGKLFLETEYLPATETLLCRRRPRSPEEKPIWGLHVLAAEGQTFGPTQFETDRARFLGRGRTPANPAAMVADSPPLSGTVGAVLDAVFSLRRRVRVKAGASVSLAFTTAVAASRDEAIELADHYHDYHGINRAFELAWAHSQVDLRQLQLTAGDTHLFQRLAAHVIYAGAALRAPATTIAANRQGQSGLWRHGISGDLPIVLGIIGDPEELGLARQLIAAHTFWRLKGLAADLVIINEQDGGYLEGLQEEIQALVRASEDRGLLDKPGGVHLRKATHLSADDRLLLQAAAHCVLVGERGGLAAQLDRLERQATPAQRSPARRDATPPSAGATIKAGPPLLFDNGRGGFSADGKEFIVRLPAEAGGYALPPQPWINVIANPDFGTLVSERGGGFTWAGNSQSNRLTPWQNDFVTDAPGEIIYLRDDRMGPLWTATPHPLGAPADFRVRHGQGYTVFEHTRDDLSHELTVFVPCADPIKISRLKIRNQGERPRRLNVAFFADLVLGRARAQTGPHIVTEIDPESGALLGRCVFTPDYPSHVAFADVNLRPRTLTADRTEFLGRNGSIAGPNALDSGSLSGKIGAGLDPCAALLASVVVPARGESEIVFLLGEAADQAEARRLVQHYQAPANVQAAWVELTRFWDKMLGAVAIRTPDPALDMLCNRWLPYQVLACRMWARSALYQSGGAYGFRDQLQDCLALVYALPDEARRHIVRAAGRQFPEGDVQHWWHLPSGAGVRTRFSDDFLWLPFVVEHYTRITGDFGVLDERAFYLQAPRLAPGQDEDYRVPERSDENGTVYEHCLRALDHGFRLGAHGLPLMGTGDWNDGMNRVGAAGKGESVWTGWFLLKVARDFADVCARRGDADRAGHYREAAEQLRLNLEEHAWDGQWYRRAYFDDGRPLGANENDECSIDSLAQTWAVISNAGQPERARQAMAEVDARLVRREDKMVLLLTPPFDQGSLQPGYIKGYVPGTRENGGQYTHAALWVAQAFALLGQGDKAVEVLDILNPIRHATNLDEVERFRVEPYVVPADVYSEAAHVGRGGWSWYTGSAAWFYRVVLETVLGFERKGATFRIQPRIPKTWAGYELVYRFGGSTYRIRVETVKESRGELPALTLDGSPRSDPDIPLVDDGREHEVIVCWEHA
jgi:cyclic beta-1,2-glucan synthetase